MANVIVIVILIALVGWACHYIYKNKKNGVKCIGCPYAESCCSSCNRPPKTNKK